MVVTSQQSKSWARNAEHQGRRTARVVMTGRRDNMDARAAGGGIFGRDSEGGEGGESGASVTWFKQVERRWRGWTWLAAFASP